MTSPDLFYPCLSSTLSSCQVSSDLLAALLLSLIPGIVIQELLSLIPVVVFTCSNLLPFQMTLHILPFNVIILVLSTLASSLFLFPSWSKQWTILCNEWELQ